MSRLSKQDLLAATDLKTREVELPSIGGSVLVQGLSAAYSNQAQSEALETTFTKRGDQVAKVNTSKLEIIQAQHGLVEPALSSYEEAEKFAQNCGPAFRAVIDAIDELSGLDKEAIAEAAATFPAGGEETGGADVDDGTPPRSPGPAVPA